jgi:hypothetical protein
MMHLARVLSPKVPRVGNSDEPQRSQVGAATGPRRTITGPLVGGVADAVETGIAAAQSSDAVHSHLEDEQRGGLHH